MEDIYTQPSREATDMTLAERISFAKVISPLNGIPSMDHEDISKNIDSGFAMLADPKRYNLTEDDMIVVKYWIAEYESELNNRYNR